MKKIEDLIFIRLNLVKEKIKDHEKISFSRIETNFRSNDNKQRSNYLLSIILAGDFFVEGMNDDSEPITEMVIDFLTIHELGLFEAVVDLSYGNGIIIKEVTMKKVKIETECDELFEFLDANFFNSITEFIYNSLDLLSRVRG